MCLWWPGARAGQPGCVAKVVTVEVGLRACFAVAFVGWDDNIDVDEDRGRHRILRTVLGTIFGG